MYDLFRFFSSVWFFFIGIRHSIRYESIPDPNSEYIFIANHIAYIDAPIVISSIKHHFRPLGKYELLKVPIFGFIYKFCVITVNRSNPEDRARSLADLRKILSHGISILVFPEGTFNMTDSPLKDMYDGAFKLAIETGKKIQPILLLDTFDRMNYNNIFSLTPGHSRAIYLAPINPLDYPGQDPKQLKQIAEKIMADKLIAYKASWISPNYLITSSTHSFVR